MLKNNCKSPKEVNFVFNIFSLLLFYNPLSKLDNRICIILYIYN